MKSLTPSSCWSAMAKAGLVLACVLGQMPVHATEEEVVVGPANDMGSVIVTNDRVKLPHKHRRVVQVPVKPPVTPSKPQQPVFWLR
jgi:hypothetical protein